MQVELSIASSSPLEYIAIDDLLPAGLEIENPRLLTTAADAVERPKEGANRQPLSRLPRGHARRPARGHRHLTSAGTGTFVYTARAVTPGKFVCRRRMPSACMTAGPPALSEGGTFEVQSPQAARIANVRDEAEEP